MRLARTIGLHARRIAALLGFAAAALACTQAMGAAALPESVVMVPKKSGLFTTELETTIYQPDGAGPFPIVVINHGKANGDPRFQGRYRPLGAVRFFLARGYAVVVPMRQGFSKSTGSYIGGGCNVESNGREQAGDVAAVLDYVTAQLWADKTRIVVAGQSHGGWTTLAFGTLNYPGVKGLIDFAGGLKQEQCVGWQQGLIGAAGSYGKGTSVPSLWFYGDNDSYFPPFAWKGMHESYVAAGGRARLVAFGTFGGDSHSMFGAADGARIWQPEVAKFLREIGMPDEPRAEFARYAVEPAMPPSGFAAIDAVDRVPDQSEASLKGYRVFLEKPSPRAFAASSQGGWGSAWGGEDPRGRAMESCARKAPAGGCQLYAVDANVVWKPEQ
ncbi:MULTISPECIES: CocE/NonD family hydrolase [unclassified Variovorax]|jgi:dienelactone hydrolase|uniref:dienelactone hydrolase family protein n=1 Tax=unclassified Variovorax TaxID=663243 RepID=UPI001F0CC337|nr:MULTISPECIES: CocE/NonD family hydrolase [unclassified Variovorax]